MFLNKPQIEALLDDREDWPSRVDTALRWALEQDAPFFRLTAVVEDNILHYLNGLCTPALPDRLRMPETELQRVIAQLVISALRG